MGESIKVKEMCIKLLRSTPFDDSPFQFIRENILSIERRRILLENSESQGECGSSLSLKVKVKVKSLSRVWLFATPWTVAHQAPPSMGFSSQEYCSGVPFPSPGDLPNPGIEPRSPAFQADTLTSEPPGNRHSNLLKWLVHWWDL